MNARCGAKVGWGPLRGRCDEPATRAFDVWNPWRAGGAYRGVPKEHLHYEVCEKHAEEYWGGVNGGRYLDADEAKAIRSNIEPWGVAA